MQTMSEQDEVLEEAPLFIRWNPDRSPYAIELKLDLVLGLTAEIDLAAENDHEIGGLLYGTTPTPGIPILRIEDFVAVPGRPEDGRTYMLDPKQQESFAEVRWTKRKEGRTAIGFFRSNARGGLLRPTLTDRGLISAQFKDGVAPVLLVDAKEPRSGVFFLARNGQLPDEPSVQEFAFDDADFRSLPEIEPTIPTDSLSAGSPAASRQLQYAWAAAAVAGLLLIIVAIWSFVRPGPSGRLDLAVSGRSGAIDISWNHALPQIGRAVDATLTVTNGTDSQAYKLERDELRLGAVHYKTDSPELKVNLALNMPDSTSLTQSIDWRAP